MVATEELDDAVGLAISGDDPVGLAISVDDPVGLDISGDRNPGFLCFVLRFCLCL